MLGHDKVVEVPKEPANGAGEMDGRLVAAAGIRDDDKNSRHATNDTSTVSLVDRTSLALTSFKLFSFLDVREFDSQ